MSHSKSSVIDHQSTSSATHDLLASVAFKRIGPTFYGNTILKRRGTTLQIQCGCYQTILSSSFAERLNEIDNTPAKLHVESPERFG
jgi:hypothetical protein